MLNERQWGTSAAGLEREADIFGSAPSAKVDVWPQRSVPGALVTKPHALTNPVHDSAEDAPLPSRLGWRQTLLLIEKLRLLRDAHTTDGRLAACFCDAFDFIGALPRDILTPQVWTDGESEVAFEWITTGHHAVVSIEGDGKLNYSYRVNGLFIPGENYSASAKSMPADLDRYLHKF